jgi:hypothetical protein
MPCSFFISFFIFFPVPHCSSNSAAQKKKKEEKKIKEGANLQKRQFS